MRGRNLELDYGRPGLGYERGDLGIKYRFCRWAQVWMLLIQVRNSGKGAAFKGKLVNLGILEISDRHWGIHIWTLR